VGEKSNKANEQAILYPDIFLITLIHYARLQMFIGDFVTIDGG
jgi:hypothetical protein